MVTTSAIEITSALNLASHLLLLLRVDVAAMGELHTSLTHLHQLNADHVVSVICSIQCGIIAHTNYIIFSKVKSALAHA